jgi:hypothetical protein
MHAISRTPCLANVDPALESGLLWERLTDALVAAGLILIVTALFFPRLTLSSLRRVSPPITDPAGDLSLYGTTRAFDGFRAREECSLTPARI